MDLEQTVKDLQDQNSQFHDTLLNLAKGQQEMMTLLVTKKKTKRKAVINIGKRFKGPLDKSKLKRTPQRRIRIKMKILGEPMPGMETIKYLKTRIILMRNIHRTTTSISN